MVFQGPVSWASAESRSHQSRTESWDLEETSVSSPPAVTQNREVWSHKPGREGRYNRANAAWTSNGDRLLPSKYLSGASFLTCAPLSTISGEITCFNVCSLIGVSGAMCRGPSFQEQDGAERKHLLGPLLGHLWDPGIAAHTPSKPTPERRAQSCCCSPSRRLRPP